MTYIRRLRDLGKIVGRTDIKKPQTFDLLPEVLQLLEREGHTDLETAWTNTKIGPWMVWFLTRSVVPKEDRHRLVALALHMAGMLHGNVEILDPENPTHQLMLAATSYLKADGKTDKEAIRKAMKRSKVELSYEYLTLIEWGVGIEMDLAVIAAAEACLASDTRKVARHTFEAMYSVLCDGTEGQRTEPYPHDRYDLWKYRPEFDEELDGDSDEEPDGESDVEFDESVLGLYAHIADAVRMYFPGPPAMPVGK